MAAEPEVLITSLWQKTETSFQSQNGVTKLAALPHVVRQHSRQHKSLPNIEDGRQ